MRLVRFGAEHGREIERFGSEGFRIVHLAEVGDGLVSCIQLGTGGRIGRHPAVGRQVFAVVAGEGTVSGADGIAREISPGVAAVWEPGEEHETRTAGGLTAIVVEGSTVDVLASS